MPKPYSPKLKPLWDAAHAFTAKLNNLLTVKMGIKYQLKGWVRVKLWELQESRLREQALLSVVKSKGAPVLGVLVLKPDERYEWYIERSLETGDYKISWKLV